MTTPATHDHGVPPANHPLLDWLHHLVEHFNGIYVRRYDLRTDRWRSVPLANLPVGESFDWIAYWAGRRQMPVAIGRDELLLEIHPAVTWLSHLIEHIRCIHVAYDEDDGSERHVPLCELPIEQAFYWISVWACGTDAYVSLPDEDALSEVAK